MITEMMAYLGLETYSAPPLYDLTVTIEGKNVYFYRGNSKVLHNERDIPDTIRNHIKNDLTKKCREKIEIEHFKERVGCNPWTNQ